MRFLCFQVGSLDEKGIVGDGVESVLAKAYQEVLEFVQSNSGEEITIVLDHPGDIGLGQWKYETNKECREIIKLILNYNLFLKKWREI